MAKYKLTALIAARAQPRDDHYLLGDGNCLYLKVYPTNRKQWVLRKTTRGCAMMKILGEYPEMSLAQARKAAVIENQNYEDGRKAHAERRILFKDLVQMWLEARNVSDNTLKHDIYCLQTWDELAKREIKDIKPYEVRALLESSIAKGQVAAARRKLSLIAQIERFALGLGLIDMPKLQYIARTLPRHEVKHYRSLPADQLEFVFQTVYDSDRNPTEDDVDLIKALCLTLCRIGEVLSLRFEWVDYDEKVIVIPAENMKAKREHRIPLTSQLEKLIARRDKGKGGYVFASDRSDTGTLSRNTFIHRSKLKEIITPHGFRSMGRSWMSLQGFSFEASEYCLAHRAETRTQIAYQRYDYLEQRREIMKCWCDYVESCYKPYFPDLQCRYAVYSHVNAYAGIEAAS